MKGWKRGLFVAYLACLLAVTASFFAWSLGSGLHPAVKFLCFVLALVVFAGFCAGLAALVLSFAHERAALQVGPDGVVNIEKSALESCARSALSQFDDVTVAAVHATVYERKGNAVMDFTVVAVPHGTDSLMSIAARMQASVKRSIEAFTDHEVRYVGVNFIEPKTKDDVRAVRAAAERYASGPYRPARCRADGAGGDEPGRADPTPDVSPAREDGPGEAAPTLVDRLRGLWARRDPGEDVVDTPAVVREAEPAAEGAGKEAAGPADAAPAADGRVGEVPAAGAADGPGPHEGAVDVPQPEHEPETKNGGA
jgi:hypothetical protein